MDKIIGGVMPLPNVMIARQENTNTLYVANARSAMFIVADYIQPKTVWLPSFHCPSMLESFVCNVRFYEVDSQLKPNLDSLEICPEDIVVGINYFGFPTAEKVLECARCRGAWTIEDSSQCLLTTPSIHADYVVYSPRKFLPMPDGGILVNRTTFDLNCALACQPCDWFCKSMMAMDHRRRNEMDNVTWYKLFLESKKNAPIGYYAMSLFSHMLLNEFDLKEIGDKQRSNYQYLYSRLKNIALFAPDKETVPIGFPVVLKNRDLVRKRLFENNVFPPIHWDIEHELSKTIMTLPCDHRYDDKDMAYICDVMAST